MDFASAAAAAQTPAGAVGAGCDLVHVPDFRDKLHPRFLQRAFAAAEIAHCEDRAESFAARWAAKEAAYKAVRQLAEKLGEDPAGLGVFRDYVVEAGASKVPSLRLGGRPAALVEKLRGGGARVEVGLSLTHDGDYAAAFVVVGVHPEGA